MWRGLLMELNLLWRWEPHIFVFCMESLLKIYYILDRGASRLWMLWMLQWWKKVWETLICVKFSKRTLKKESWHIVVCHCINLRECCHCGLCFWNCHLPGCHSGPLSLIQILISYTNVWHGTPRQVAFFEGEVGPHLSLITDFFSLQSIP